MLRQKSFNAILVAAIFILCMPSVKSQAFTGQEMETILQTIDGYFFTPTATKKMEIRKFLRAAFHDCMGGCDGSIKLTSTDNRGLEAFTRVVTQAYTQSLSTNNNLFKRLSRADFWVLCELRALGWGIKNSNTPIKVSGAVFSYGRTSPSSAQTGPTEATLPNAAGSWQAMMSNFHVGIPTLLESDVVTLFGLHTAGTAEPTNSGFRGPWGPVADKNVINNHFYINLLNTQFPQAVMEQVVANDTTFPTNPANDPTHLSLDPPTNLVEWVHTAGQSNAKMMLPIDMQIYLKFTPDSVGRTTAGDYCPQGNNQILTDCTRQNTQSKRYLPLAKNAPLAWTYAKSNTAWLGALIPAFLKMVSYTNPTKTLTPFTPKWVCVNKVATCYGDILFGGCQTVKITC